MTDTYQRTSRREGAVEPDPSLFAKAPVRPLSTEQLYFALSRASGMDARLDRAGRADARRQKEAFFTAFSFVFDDDEMTETEDFHGSVPQGLFLLNSRLLQGAVAARGATLVRSVLTSSRDPSERVRRLWLSAYAREPEPAEARSALAYLRQSDGDAAYEDLFWVLLNSAEFMTNH
jgi:hypothetical protein